MISKPLNFSKLIFLFIFLFITGETLYERIIQNSYPLFWLDEPLELFVAVHTPFTANFFDALKKIISSMPLFYIEYWVYLKFLYSLIPLNQLMKDLEFYLRLPLMFYSILTIVSMAIMTWRLSRSYVFAGVTTLLLFTVNHLSNHLGSELRFHSAGFAHCALSWCCFTLFLTSTHSSKYRHYLYFICWIASSILAGFSHIFSIYSVFLQLFLFILVNLNIFPGIAKSTLNLPAKIIGFLILVGSVVAEGIFFILSSPKPYPRDAILKGLEAVEKSITLLNSYIFIPGLWLWIGGFCLFAFVSFKRTQSFKDKLRIIFIFLLGLAQIMLILYFSWKYLKWTWGPETWMPRYVTAGMIPFVFFLSYFAQNLIIPKWENKIALVTAAIALSLFILKPSWNDSYWGSHTTHYGDERWIKLRKDILSVKGYGQVDYVFGLKASMNPLLQNDSYDNSVDLYWQLYSGGPLSITTLDKITPFGGRIPLNCESRKMMPEAILEGTKYGVDFCENNKVTLRIVK